MGVSFKVSKTGKRFLAKPLPSAAAASFASPEEDHSSDVIAPSRKPTDLISISTRKLGEASENKSTEGASDNEVSFTLSLFPDGYSISKPVENEAVHQTTVDVPKLLHPYDRASESLFSAIESGRLPGEILNDLPCKFANGTVVCEVRDYRKCFSEGPNAPSADNSPIINRVCLRMSLENIVKDIPAISDNDWTYGDLMEVESRILKALQPKLSLDPTPQLDKLSDHPGSAKLNLALSSMRRKRLRQIPDVAVSTHNINGKKVCLEVAESSRLRDPGCLVQQASYENLTTQNNVSSSMLPLRSNSIGSDGSLMQSPLVSHQQRYQVGVGSPKMVKDQRSGALINASVASPGGQDMMIPFTDNGASSIHGKRDSQDGQSSPLTTNKKARLTHAGADGNLQPFGQQMDHLHGSEVNWKNAFMQHQAMGRGIPYANNGVQKFSQQIFEGGLNQESVGQQGMRYNLKEEPVETERLDKPEFGRMTVGEPELTNNDPQARLQQRMQHQLMRSSFPQSPWNNLGQPLDNNARKDDSFQKRKLAQSPRISTGGLPQSPLSSKSGEFSSGSMGAQFGAVSGLVSQKEKSTVATVTSAGVGGNPPLQNQQQAAAKRRLNSLPKTAPNAVGSPASGSSMGIPINASSPPVGGTQGLSDQSMLERFSKIEMVSMRCQLNSRKNKVEEHPVRKPSTFSGHQLASVLSSDLNNENMKDEPCKTPLSRSLVGGDMNVYKARILTFIPTERMIQGNSFQYVPKARTRMIMSEKPSDGTVAFHIGEIDDAEYLAVEDYLPTLPNTHTADLLAAQFSSLMAREGYHVEDHVQPKPPRMNPSSVGQVNTPGIPPGGATPDTQQFSEGVSVQPSNEMAKPNVGGNAPVNSSQNLQASRMLPPGHMQAIQMSQGLIPGVSMPARPQQPEQLSPLQQQSQQQFQRSSMVLPANSMQHMSSMSQNANMQLGPHMTNNLNPLQQFQLMQQQPQKSLQSQQQQQTMQRKMMSGLGTVGMGNMNSNMVGLGGLGNVMGIGGARGVGGAGISAPMGQISNIGNMNQNPMNITSGSSIGNSIRPTTLTAAQAAFMKLKIQNRNLMANSQAGIGGMPGARQMHPGSPNLSMLNPALNRANINQMQRTAMGQMGPPKLMSGMNLYMNQQQQQQMQLQQQQQQQMQMQQQHLQQQQQQQLQPQQETTSPLQAVVSPQQVGSPSSMGIPMNQPQQQQQQQQQQTQQPQQQASPQQIAQRTPMSPQLSSGPLHQMTSGNPEAGPASPQLSSQTLGSVGSITNSPMELQGVNKSNSVNNA